jgi:hypothetical protein
LPQIRDVPPPYCVRLSFFDFSCWPENFGSLQITASIVAEYSANLVLIERGGPITTSTAN